MSPPARPVSTLGVMQSSGPPAVAGSLKKPKDLITYLDNGKAVCYDHHFRVCHICGLDLTFDDDDSLEDEDEDDEADYDDDDDDDEGEDEDLDQDEDEDSQVAAQKSAVPPGLLLGWSDRSFILAGGSARFVPQWEEALVSGAALTRMISQKHDYDNPPTPKPPSSLSLHYCSTCHLTWLGGRAGRAGVSDHPSHHTLDHEYSGTRRSMMVFVDGACASNGTRDATGGIGVYFGPDSPFNQSVPLVLQPGERSTSQKAEINSVITALRLVRSQIMPARHSMCRAVSDSASAIRDATQATIVIITDSSYLVEAMCRHYSGWVYDKEAGKLRNKRGQMIEGSDGFRQITWEVEVLSMMGVQVQYYQVSREHNVNADALARRATQRAVANT